MRRLLNFLLWHHFDIKLESKSERKRKWPTVMIRARTLVLFLFLFFSFCSCAHSLLFSGIQLSCTSHFVVFEMILDFYGIDRIESNRVMCYASCFISMLYHASIMCVYIYKRMRIELERYR